MLAVTWARLDAGPIAPPKYEDPAPRQRYANAMLETARRAATPLTD